MAYGSDISDCVETRSGNDEAKSDISAIKISSGRSDWRASCFKHGNSGFIKMTVLSEVTVLSEIKTLASQKTRNCQ